MDRITNFFSKITKTSSTSKQAFKSIIYGITSKEHQALAISVSTNDQLEQLPKLINLLREKSKNPGVIVLIGGPLYNKAPDEFEHIQADIKAFSPEESVQKLEQHLSQLEKNN